MKNSNRIGILYASNSKGQKNIVKKTIEQLEICTKNLIDVIVCSNEPIENNKFVTIYNHICEYGRTSIYLHILSLLYYAKDAKKYKYVVFLEQDVLYTEQHFLFKDFECDYIFNSNYIGLSKNGWQKLPTNPMVTWNMIMNLDFAINHFENLLKQHLRNIQTVLEPSSANYIVWHSLYPNIHINYGFHHTGHFQLYKGYENKTPIEYWGDYLSYSDLFL